MLLNAGRFRTWHRKTAKSKPRPRVAFFLVLLSPQAKVIGHFGSGGSSRRVLLVLRSGCLNAVPDALASLLEGRWAFLAIPRPPKLSSQSDAAKSRTPGITRNRNAKRASILSFSPVPSRMTVLSWVRSRLDRFQQFF